jgi:hypothetical protein
MNSENLRHLNSMKRPSVNKSHPDRNVNSEEVPFRSRDFGRKIELRIDKNVPLPTENIMSLCRKTLLKMNVGDSVLSDAGSSTWTIAAAHVGRRVITRKERDKIRAWRVA